MSDSSNSGDFTVSTDRFCPCVDMIRLTCKAETFRSGKHAGRRCAALPSPHNREYLKHRGRCYGSILVPSTLRNSASQSGCAGQSGAVTRLPPTWLLSEGISIFLDPSEDANCICINTGRCQAQLGGKYCIGPSTPINNPCVTLVSISSARHDAYLGRGRRRNRQIL